MGIATWMAAGLIAWALARLIPLGKTGAALAELAAALGAALLCGAAATALDFGGWQELDWRAAAFAFLGASAAVPLVRLAGRRPAASSRQ
jgi:uncharacterized membrane protein YeaQ/YmgE (transglycosylase-associated protein family)